MPLFFTQSQNIFQGNEMVDYILDDPPLPPPSLPSAAQGRHKRKKRTRAAKTREEAESQRMTHIAVERNRRKQMNQHLSVIRSLMPNSYIQRGDQASIVGGAIEFVKELEQLLQCLESQKRQRIYGDDQKPIVDPSMALHQPIQINDDKVKMVEYKTMLKEETAERKSCFANVEVKLVGFDGLINILSRRIPGQLIKAIATLEDLQLHILQTDVTAIEESVAYSFLVKMSEKAGLAAEDIADSVQQIFSFMPKVES